MGISKIIPSRLVHTNLPADYQFFVTALGFERRARHIAEVVSPVAHEYIAWGFQDRQVLNYSANANWFAGHGYEIFEDDDDNIFLGRFKEMLSKPTPASGALGCVDISSLTRKRMAAIVELCCSGHLKSGTSIDFLYSLGAYSPPPQEVAPNTALGPISPFFSGWTLDPNKPPVAIVGLGYEEGKALGAIEYIQADEAWVFIPESAIQLYSPAVLDANSILLKFVNKRQQITYHPDDPVDCFLLLESLLHGVVPFGRPVILPFGPKIFALVALLACTKYEEASVWRVSAQQGESPIDRLPSDNIIGLRVTFYS